MSLLTYSATESVALVTMNDGKANALSPAMLAGLNGAFDRADEDDIVAVVLAGRPGRFSGGFDLGVLGAGGTDAVAMLRSGFELAERLLSFRKPIVVACTGHSLAMGSFLMLSADYRVGAAGDYKIQANEVAIGLTMPHAALAILRYRLTPAAFDRAAALAETFDPDTAVRAGYLDRVVPVDDVVPTAMEIGASFTGLDATAHAATKLRARARVLTELREGIEGEFGS